MKTKIELHADDYGMNMESSKRILDCFLSGNLDSISVLPNGCFAEAIRLADGLPINFRIHINLVEGKCLSDWSDIPLLANEKGYFKHSFVGIFFLMLSPKRKEAGRQIELEMKRQLQCAYLLSAEGRIGIDSHQHIHMIPGVFRILCKEIKEMNLKVEKLRIPAEPVLPFLRHPSLYHTYHLVNIAKNCVLNFLYLFIKKDVKELGITPAVFMGIMFSGCMDSKRILTVLPDFKRIAEKRGASMELLFHPGNILPDETAMDPGKESFLKFYYSPERRKEAALLKSEEFHKALRGCY